MSIKIYTDKEKIIQYLENKGVSKNKFYKETGLSNGFLDSGSSFTLENLRLILDKYRDLNPDWLLDDKEPMRKKLLEERAERLKNLQFTPSIPLIPIEAMAGYSKGEMTVMESDIQERYVIPEFTRKGVKYIIRVSGSSMYPKYSNGDLLGCKPIEDDSFFQWGKPYVLDTDQGPIVKRLYPVQGKEDVFECRSDNAEMYPPFKIKRNSIYKIAIVVGVIRQE